MNKRNGWPKILALGLVGAFLASACLPAASAQSMLNVRSVGEIFVDASGRASGQNVAASITEAKGLLEGFTALALNEEIFASVAIDGFAQAEKIQGVGSSSILLRGSNAVVSIYDNINSEFRIQATSPTTVRYDVGEGMFTQASSSHSLAMYASSGAYVGSLVLVGANGPAPATDAIATTGGDVRASLSAGSQVVWLSRPVYVDSQAYNDALVSSLAAGYLSSKIVTEYEGSAQASSQVDYLAHVQSRAVATQDHAVESVIASRAESSTVVAYDLAYESLPASSSQDVAMYVNGQLAVRADSASDVQSYAAAGLASYHAFAANGRTQILASTPDFRTQAEHRLTFVARGVSAPSASQARADSAASTEARATGAYALHANGKLTGLFTTGILASDQMAVHDFTSLQSRTEIFNSVTIGGAPPTGTDEGEHEITMTNPDADVTMFDDVYATMLLEARAQTSAAFDLGSNVKATSEGSNLVRLAGPNGFAGVLILADASASGRSSLSVPSDGEVRSQLEPGARLVFRSQTAAEAHASEAAVADAIAAGQVGAQVLAGIQGNAVSTSSVDYSKSVDTQIVSSARGSYKIDYVSRAETSKAFVFDSRGTALAAKSASDIQVVVNGQAATAVSTPQAVFASGNTARFFVDTTLQSQTRVIVNTASAMNAKSQVEIKSRLDSDARAAANTDAFGTFKMFYDGTAVGNFVSLRTNQQAGVVNDFTMISTGQTMFTSIQAGASAFVTGGAEGAPQLMLENREAQMEFTDTTSAYMRIVAKQDTSTNLNLAPDIRAEQRSNAVVELVNAQGAHLGSLIITDVEGKAAASSSFQATTGDQVRANLEKGAQVIFRTHVGIEAELSSTQRTMINHAIAAGRVAGQVLVMSQATLSAQAHAQASVQADARSSLEATSRTAHDGASSAVSAVEVQGRVTTAVTASYYNDVQMVTAATQSRVDITVSSATSVGKTVLVSLDPATLPGMATGDATILVDGKAAMQASSYADILNPTDDAGAYEYFVLAGEAGTQVLVSMPHFSTHTVTLKERDASTPPIFMYATIFLGVLVAVETVVLVRRRTA